MQDDHFWPLQWSATTELDQLDQERRQTSERIVKKPISQPQIYQPEHASKKDPQEEIIRSYRYRTHPAILANIPLSYDQAPEAQSSELDCIQDVFPLPPPQELARRQHPRTSCDTTRLAELRACGSGSSLRDYGRVERGAGPADSNDGPSYSSKLRLMEKLDSLVESHLSEDDKINLSYFLNEFETRKCDLGELLASLLENILLKLQNPVIKYKLLELVTKLYVSPALIEGSPADGNLLVGSDIDRKQEIDLGALEALMRSYLSMAADGMAIPERELARNLAPNHSTGGRPIDEQLTTLVGSSGLASGKLHPFNFSEPSNYSFQKSTATFSSEDPRIGCQLGGSRAAAAGRGRRLFEASDINDMQPRSPSSWFKFISNNEDTDEQERLELELVKAGGVNFAPGVSDNLNKHLFWELGGAPEAAREKDRASMDRLNLNTGELERQRLIDGPSHQSSFESARPSRQVYGGGEQELALEGLPLGWANYATSSPVRSIRGAEAARCVRTIQNHLHAQDNWQLVAGKAPHVDPEMLPGSAHFRPLKLGAELPLDRSSRHFYWPPASQESRTDSEWPTEFEQPTNARTSSPQYQDYIRPYRSQLDVRPDNLAMPEHFSPVACWPSAPCADFRCCSSMSVPCQGPAPWTDFQEAGACYRAAWPNFAGESLNSDYINQPAAGGGNTFQQSQQSADYYKVSFPRPRIVFNQPVSLPSSPIGGRRDKLGPRQAPLGQHPASLQWADQQRLASSQVWPSAGSGRKSHRLRKHAGNYNQEQQQQQPPPPRPPPRGRRVRLERPDEGHRDRGKEEEEQEGDQEEEEEEEDDDSVVSVVVAPAMANLPLSIAEQMKEQASNFLQKFSDEQDEEEPARRHSSNPRRSSVSTGRRRPRQRPNLQVRRTLRVKIKKSKPILGIAIEGGFNVSGQLLPRIVCVHEDGAAYQCGKLRASDLILEVNGISTVNMTHDEIAKTIANAYYQDQRPFIEFLIVDSTRMRPTRSSQIRQPIAGLLVSIIAVTITLNLGSNFLEATSPSPHRDQDPCENVECDRGMCKIMGHGLLRCWCPKVCDKFFEPVCGSDGQTYNNHCMMAEASCRRGMIIKIISDGRCPERK